MPRLGMRWTSPSASNMRTASRTQVRLTPVSSQSSRSVSFCFGLKCMRRMASRSVRVVSSRRFGRSLTTRSAPLLSALAMAAPPRGPIPDLEISRDAALYADSQGRLPGGELEMRASKTGIEINYTAQGSGPPVTLVHGVGADFQSWDAIAESLARTHQVIRMDLRGHGQSSRIATCSLEDFLDDVVLVLDTLGIARTHLVGFSLGGMIAQGVALAHPERIQKLALISAVAGRTPEERANVQVRARKVREEGIASVVAAAEDRWFT